MSWVWVVLLSATARMIQFLVDSMVAMFLSIVAGLVWIGPNTQVDTRVYMNVKKPTEVLISRLLYFQEGLSSAKWIQSGSHV